MGFFSDLGKGIGNIIGGTLTGIGNLGGSLLSGFGSMLGLNNGCQSAPGYCDQCAQGCQGEDPCRAMQLHRFREAMMRQQCYNAGYYQGFLTATALGASF
jgi:hypothetical protein